MRRSLCLLVLLMALASTSVFAQPTIVNGVQVPNPQVVQRISSDCADPTATELLDINNVRAIILGCLLYTSPSPRDQRGSRMPSSA